MELTLAAAIFAGLVSFISPCVLPVVPAYLGQLGITAAAATVGAGTAGGALALARPTQSRWQVLPHAIAFVLGFGVIFVLLGLTAYVFRPLFELPLARQIGGVLLVILGLNLMGILRLRRLAGSWRPFERFGQQPLGGLAARSPLGALALGSIFAIGWTPCVGPTLGAILGLSLTAGAAPQVVLLLGGYTLGLGVPFILMALALDGGRRFTQPILRHGRLIELIGGGLVVIIGLAIFFDWLGWLATRFQFLWPMV
ncbi:MAG TPA: cytochrome c biogenesis CcdA family protein [Candidatus Limnocylindria bacterium]|nr:cytochrome c biogenesis CcdA family protein [Candidatus Limnocylindria bacterium]